MELLLRTDIEHLGRAGEVVKVRSGYARNYLIPQKLAVDVTPENLRLVEKDRKVRVENQKKELAELRELAAKLSDATCTIAAKAAEGGHLYGSINAAAIAEALGKMGLKVDEKSVRLESPIKEKGTFPVKIHLHAEVEATTHVVVVDEAAG